ncbi:tetratricopeptide repeat protein [Ramlibacter paludis]|uniref:tetratricopeptide repeat protein n=1 Tax=Ramlibacter paludis TaxID=2908000 RepID=UPI003D2BD26A
MPAADEATTYTLRRVQAMLGLSRHIVLGLIAAGFVQPTRGKRNEWRFTFQDLALLRTAHALQAQHLKPRRILASLARLKADLPAELPLSGLRITAVGGDVAVRDRSGRLQSDSGQLLMDFEVGTVAGNVTVLQRPASRKAREADAFELFDRGLALEATDTAAAEAAYLQALLLAPDLEDAYLNLGAMWADAGRYEDLVRLSATALQNCPNSAVLHFNRGVALDHLERLDEAADAYERSLELDPNLADAHYNLAELRKQAGDERGALRHYSAYHRLQR